MTSRHDAAAKLFSSRLREQLLAFAAIALALAPLAFIALSTPHGSLPQEALLRVSGVARDVDLSRPSVLQFNLGSQRIHYASGLLKYDDIVSAVKTPATLDAWVAPGGALYALDVAGAPKLTIEETNRAALMGLITWVSVALVWALIVFLVWRRHHNRQHASYIEEDDLG